MQCYVHTCSDEGDSPVVIDRFSSIHRHNTISVHNLPHER